MTQEGRFSWQRMGQADYGRCAAMVASLPQEVRHALNASEHGVLTQILYLCWLYASKSGRGAAYCIPSENYLAQSIGRSVRTVRRCLVALREMGLVEVTWRRPIRQTWQTNMYGLGKRLLAVIYASVGKKVQQYQRGTLSSHNNLKKGIEGATEMAAPSNSPSSREKLQALLASFRASGPKLAAQQEEKTTSAVEDRRTLLKEQAKSLRERGL